jgi:hypothetical protein
MTLKIYTVHHFVPQWYLATDVFVPMVVGDAANTPELPADIQTDAEVPRLEGHSYAEMRAHYWVWQHMPEGVDYIGFQHYRRTFADPASAMRNAPELHGTVEHFVRRELSLVTSWIRRWTVLADIVVPRPVPAQPHLGADYARSHSEADWQVLLDALPPVCRALAASEVIDYIYRANMFVMRLDLFEEYMTWWHAVMSRIAARITPPAEGYQSRTFGFMSERLFTLWLFQQRHEHPECRIIELPILIGNFRAI